MKKRWQVANQESSLVQKLSESAKISPLLATLLINRGIQDPQSAHTFLNPSLSQLFDPFLLDDMQKCCDRIMRALLNHEKICIYGDYDVDGATSTAMMVGFLKKLNANVIYYIPHRMQEGYSLNKPALDYIKSQHVSLIITVDNGIRAHAETSYAKNIGIDLIITDHHELDESLPNAFAVLNPKRNSTGHGQELAGVGVAFYLLMALRKVLRDADYFKTMSEPNLRECLDLVAIGTIADLCPLKGQNRILVHMGLEQIGKTKKKGLKALLKVSEIVGTPSASQVAFRLGPRINAVGRLSDASFGVKLLLSEDEFQSLELALQLDAENEERKKIEKEMTELAFQLIEEQQLLSKYKSIILHHPDFHVGVVGIVASRIVEKFHLPCIILGSEENYYKGSARSIRGMDMVAALTTCEDLLVKYGGHYFAAGLTLTQENFETFYNRFDTQVRQQLQSEDDFIPKLKVDAKTLLSEINHSFIEELKILAPYGMGNPEPLFVMDVSQVANTKIVGEKHLKGSIQEGSNSVAFIGFNMAEFQNNLSQDSQVVFSPEINYFNGLSNIQLVIKDLQSPSITRSVKK